MRGIGGEYDPCRISSDTRNGQQMAEELLLFPRGEAIEQMGILTDDFGDKYLALGLSL